jgi:hypothetical protein
MSFRYIYTDDAGKEWSITPILRFVERLVPLSKMDPGYGSVPVNILQQKYVALDPYHHEPTREVKWVDVECEKEKGEG